MAEKEVSTKNSLKPASTSKGIMQRGLYILSKVPYQEGAKKEIAKHIAKNYVKDFDAVLLDAGSTAELIAEELFTQRKYLSVMTNNMGAYAAYSRAIAWTTEEGEDRTTPPVPTSPGIGLLNENELLLPGGRYDATYEALYGDRTIEAIQIFIPNVTIIGVSGLRFSEGVFCHGSEEVRVKHLLWTISTDTRVIAADWTKIGRRDAHAFGFSVDELGVGAKKAVVVTSKPPRDKSSEDKKEFDEQIGRMKDVGIQVDILDFTEAKNP